MLQYPFTMDGKPVLVKFKDVQYGDVARHISRIGNRMDEMARVDEKVRDIEKRREEGEDISSRKIVELRDERSDFVNEIFGDMFKVLEFVDEPIGFTKYAKKKLLDPATQADVMGLVMKFMEDVSMMGERGKNLSSGLNSKEQPQSSPSPAAPVLTT